MAVEHPSQIEVASVGGSAPSTEACDKKSEKQQEATANPMDEEKSGKVEAGENMGSEPTTTPAPKERKIFGIKVRNFGCLFGMKSAANGNVM